MAVITVEARVKEIISEKFRVFHGVPVPEMNSESVVADMLDSVDRIELHLEFEREFGLPTIDEVEWEKNRTVGNVVAYIEAHKKP